MGVGAAPAHGWSVVYTQAAVGTTRPCCSSTGNIVYICDNATTNIYKSTNYGGSWSTIGISFTPKGLACSSDGSIVYAIINTGLYKSTNSGSGFSLLSAAMSGQTGYIITGLACSGDGNVIMLETVNGSSTERMRVSADGGTTWATSVTWNSTGQGSTFAISYTNGANCALYNSGSNRMMISTNSGALFSNAAAVIPSSDLIYSPNIINGAASASGSIFIFGKSAGGIYKSTDTGATYSAIATGGSNAIVSVATSSDAFKILALETNGALRISQDSGSTWSASASPGNYDWRQCCMSQDGAIMYATDATHQQVWKYS